MPFPSRIRNLRSRTPSRVVAQSRIARFVTWRYTSRLCFLFLLAVLANPSPPSLIAIDEPETGLHPSMLPIVAEYARDAAERTQVILTTHSPEFLDAFGDDVPPTTVAECRDGETDLRVLSGGQLDYWLRQYTLGELYRYNELENMRCNSSSSPKEDPKGTRSPAF